MYLKGCRAVDDPLARAMRHLSIEKTAGDRTGASAPMCPS
jgi:hypothetical protein